MNVFLALLIKIIPLYILIALGFIAGRKLKAKKETVASLLIYTIVPVVIFNSIITTKITFEILLLPLIFLVCCSSMCILFYLIGGRLFNDNTRNILALTAGTANTGYFGVPVAIALFGEKCLGVLIISFLGFTIFENSLGFFITARGSHSISEAFSRLLKLPTIYAFIAGLLVNYLGVNPGENYITFTKNFIGVYTILGMMLIGLGLADIKSFKFDIKFLMTSLIAKFIVWPLLILFLIYIDSKFFSLFDNSVHRIMFLLSIVPLAANTVAYATELNAQPEKASLAVFLSTVIALIYIPLLTTILFK
ncbi:MAG: AEC family transporter [Candidatus Melainabacteria bacterium]|nr:AEC family transporter [Candidatus Melainabacteria bacterium]